MGHRHPTGRTGLGVPDLEPGVDGKDAFAAKVVEVAMAASSSLVVHDGNGLELAANPSMALTTAWVAEWPGQTIRRGCALWKTAIEQGLHTSALHRPSRHR